MTLAAGWHRPSDAVSAFAVVGIWTFGVSAVLVARRGTGDPARPEGLPGLVIGAVLVLGLAFGVITLSTTIDTADGLHIVRIGLAYVRRAGIDRGGGGGVHGERGAAPAPREPRPPVAPATATARI